MKKNFKYTLLYAVLSASLLTACSDSDLFDGAFSGDRQKIELTGEINQVPVTRVNDNGFVDGDVMGVYIVDYNGSNPGELKVNGNRGDNVRHTLDEANGKWSSAYDIYWKDKQTHIDVYGYYPFGNPESITDYPFTVQRDQSNPPRAARWADMSRATSCGARPRMWLPPQASSACRCSIAWPMPK